MIYLNLTEQDVMLLIAAYAKADRGSMLPAGITTVACEERKISGFTQAAFV
jgi:hypothetical protein